MRMLFEPDDGDFEAAVGVLAQRVEAWARGRGAGADVWTVVAALEYRHGGTVDGRLGLWCQSHVEEFLLDWLPRTLTVLPGQPLPDGPGDLLALLRYLDETGLADPRGDALVVLEQAIGQAAEEFASAMADPTRWGMAKFWAMTAAGQGVDVGDQAAMLEFSQRAQRHEAPCDREVLDAVMAQHLQYVAARVERAEPQLPVTLPGEEMLRERASAVALAGQLAGLAEWAGTGRELTGRGRLRLADARRLVDVLATGDRAASPRSSADLPRLSLLFAWAKQARLVRVARGRVYAVARARPVLADPLTLWERAFAVLFELRGPLLGDPGGYGATSMLFDTYEDVLPDVLNTLYSLPYPMPWPRLRDSVHLAYRARFDLGLDAAPRQRRQMWLLDADQDLRRVLDVLEQLGAITREQGMADPVFLDIPSLDTAPDVQLPDGMPPQLAHLLGALPDAPDPDAQARADAHRAELTDGPVELIRLTHLGTHAVRRRLLAQGRSAPLVGELAHAPAAGLLGVLSQEYDPDSARLELAHWTDAHAGPLPARRMLLDAVRRAPFRTRAAAFLDTLATTLPDGQQLLRSLRSDAQLAPTALSVLTHNDALAPEDLTDTESVLMVAESLLQLLETGGPDALVETLLAAGHHEATTAIGTALASGHPDQRGLAHLSRIADNQLRTRSAQLGRINAVRARQGDG